MTRRWLSIVGIGEDGLAGISAAARALIDDAEVLAGGQRHLAMLPDDGRERLGWRRPLSGFVDDIVRRKDRRVCILATGDPLFYGIGVTLCRHVPMHQMTVVPAPSAFALACARLGWPRSQVETLTLHGRPLSLLLPFIQPGARLLILSDNAETPGAVAHLLGGRGFGDSTLTVLEHMGGPAERVVSATARGWGADDIADFNTLAVECVAGPGARILPRVSGLPDDAFEHDGQLTKREVRAATMAALGPGPRQHLWDVGAGCGSIAIEWMRSHPTAMATAIERNVDRAQLLAANAAALGTPHLRILTAEAPAALSGLEPPDAVFVGGGVSDDMLLDVCWESLLPGGRLVANAVTVEGEAALFRWREQTGGALSRIAVSRAEPVGGFKGWRPLMPVTQLSAVKS